MVNCNQFRDRRQGFMREQARSGCPINMAVEALGDRWSLLVLRDIMFGNRRRFRELLAGSEEGIASNILADRLKRLVAAGLLTRENTRPGQRAAYSLTEPAIQLVPVLAEAGRLGNPGTAPPPRGCGCAPNCSPTAARTCGASSWTSSANCISAGPAPPAPARRCVNAWPRLTPAPPRMSSLPREVGRGGTSRGLISWFPLYWRYGCQADDGAGVLRADRAGRWPAAWVRHRG